MSYLARLKRLEAGEIFHYVPDSEPTKPTEPPFDGFVGSIPGANENIVNGTATAERLEQEIGALQSDPALRYAMETHTEVEADAVIVTLAIRDKAACEIRIPNSRYDGLALLELIEKHTVQVTLQ